MKHDTTFEQFEKSKKGKAKRGPARDVHVRQLDDGSFVSRTTHAPGRSTGKDSYPMSTSVERSHPNIKHAAKHLLAAFPPPQAADEEAGESAATEKGETEPQE